MNLYFAYGFNTQRSGMARRCPDARSLGAAKLPDYSFRFAHHADITPFRDSTVDGVLWEVTPECIASLDRVEGYPHYYDRKTVDVIHDNCVKQAWVYMMQPGSFETAPSDGYLDQLIDGYQEHGVSHVQIIRALVSAQREDLDYVKYKNSESDLVDNNYYSTYRGWGKVKQYSM
jgi:gamma-glutamylcyclotransferase (GGCT)/AIG2-like uncharacterized protein YtfP